MSDTVIQVENLSKRYRIGASQGYASYGSLRESLSNAIAAPFRRRSNAASPDQSRHIWALKDVTFEVRQGEVLGIIGRNGAGKSTLLKVLARITKPTEGKVKLRGRVGSLLEVGTGFHPELTGRENIFLNGAILGMKRLEIQRIFDEIVDFAEIEQFLDTPVKHYSSGMYMRLAFAVAAHLEPEILLVDEVLAVGDAAFQKKCLGKMGEAASEGRTVLFVSHNMDAIVRLCKSTLLLISGNLDSIGEPQAEIQIYLKQRKCEEGSVWVNDDFSPKLIKFVRAELVSKLENETLNCIFEYVVNEEEIGSVLAIRIDSISGAPIMTLTDNDLDETKFIKHKGRYEASILVPLGIFASGSYKITLSAADMKSTRFDFHEGVLQFDVIQSRLIKTSFKREGSLLLPIPWKVSEINEP